MKAGSAGRLLVVSYHFPPGPGVGGLRWAGLSRHLAKNGWEVRVVSAFGPAGEREFAPSVRVVGVPPQLTAADRYRNWKVARALRASPGNRGHLDGFRPAASQEVGAARRLIRSLAHFFLVWPDTGRGWIRPALDSVRELLGDFQPTAVVSSGPPHSAHLVARLALGRSKVPWYVDFRDPWTDSRRNRLANRWLERFTVRRATGMITTTNEFRASFQREHPDLPTHWIPNGVDLASLPTLSETPLPGLAVVHLGSLYLGRDPTQILEAFRQFLEACPEAAEAGSAFRFVGDGDHPWLGQVAEASRDPDRRVELSPLVPREQALAILQRSSLALVLSQGQDRMIPAKLYEAIALGVPTLVVAYRGTAAFREAKRLGAWRADPDDVPAMFDALMAAWRGESPPPPEPGVKLDHAELAQDVSAILGTHSERPRPLRQEIHSP